MQLLPFAEDRDRPAGPGGVVVIARSGAWLAVDSGLAQWLGQTPEQLLGTPAHLRLFPDQASRIDALLAALGEGGSGAVQWRFVCRMPGGRARNLLANADVARWTSDDPESVHGAAADGANDRDCCTALRLMLREVGAGDAVQQEQVLLAHGMAHDLRAALRGIDGFAALLEQQPLDTAGHEQLARIRAAGLRAGTLVDALSAYMLAGAVEHVPRTVDLSLLATWVAAELRDADPLRMVDIQVQPGMQAYGDERQLRQLLQALLDNAWRFSADTVHARIVVEGEKIGRGRFRLRIRDNGRGFDECHAARMFEPFRRLHGPDQGAGHGLGLATARRIVQRHDGDIQAQSLPAGGSVFCVELPARDDEDEG